MSTPTDLYAAEVMGHINFQSQILYAMALANFMRARDPIGDLHELRAGILRVMRNARTGPDVTEQQSDELMQIQTKSIAIAIRWFDSLESDLRKELLR